MSSQAVPSLLLLAVVSSCGGSDAAKHSANESTGGAEGSKGGVTSMAGSSAIATLDELGGSWQTFGGMLSLGGAGTGGTIVAGGTTHVSAGAASGRTGGGGMAVASNSSGRIGTTGASGASISDTGHCPAWPQSKVMPNSGIFFYGPDPGPCSSVSVGSDDVLGVRWFYTYSDRRISAIEMATSTQVFSWDQGTLRGYEQRSASSTVVVTYSWEPDAVTQTASVGAVTRYLLSATGYPIEGWSVDLQGGTSRLAVRYEYSDCRLVRRTVFASDGSVGGTSEFDYDAAGHIVAQRSASGSATEFDYSCW